MPQHAKAHITVNTVDEIDWSSSMVWVMSESYGGAPPESGEKYSLNSNLHILFLLSKIQLC